MHTAPGGRRSWPRNTVQALPCRSPSWGILRQEAGFPEQEAKNLRMRQTGPQEGLQDTVEAKPSTKDEISVSTLLKPSTLAPLFPGSRPASALPVGAGSNFFIGRWLSRRMGQLLDIRKSSESRLWPPQPI